MPISVSSILTVYHDGQFWIGLAERIEGGRYGVACIVFEAEPSDKEILQFVSVLCIIALPSMQETPVLCAVVAHKTGVKEAIFAFFYEKLHQLSIDIN